MKYIAQLSWFTALFMVISSSPLMSRIPPQFTCFTESCGTSNDKLKNSRMTYSPDPPQVNEYIKYYISGILTEQVDGGEARETNFFGTHVISKKTLDLCNLQPTWNISCPFHPGPFEITSLGHHIPPVVVPGAYGLVFNATDENHNSLFVPSSFVQFINKYKLSSFTCTTFHACIV
ncbi:putative phosphatidylglycerol/phosphatidylinositol transfer protein DDB_G0278295 isoform X1 [Dysidea avara]|uniref:putative phosphatidylglycerol/phosphatidylinositol transfer protein DDB_G0278295 isoform X1 n=1 Tax=Dysidea avara TaxID=196820 RepID=UPI00331DC98F